MGTNARRILLIDPTHARREVLARRLRAQRYAVEETADPAVGADLALASPPDAVVADLWMPAISGVQLCRLLRSEPATVDVPVILCGEHDDPRDHFWSERAGAAAYVVKGRTGALVRAIGKAVEANRRIDSFFVQLSGGGTDVRDRIARHLDVALFESVIASEVRALASAGTFERLFDLLAQFLPQVARYRWIALATESPARLAVHHHPRMREVAMREARAALRLTDTRDVTLVAVEDEDAAADGDATPPIEAPVMFGHAPVARFALAPIDGARTLTSLVQVVARELGGAVKVATLLEESQRLATIDGLTGVMNRRALTQAIEAEIARSDRHGYPMALALIDLDHFKSINDKRGHGTGDRALAAVGALLREVPRLSDPSGRWGGEEFVVLFTSTDAEGAGRAAERLRSAIEELVVLDERGERVPLSASIGIASRRSNDDLPTLARRADLAMYASKAAGRNRVTIDEELEIVRKEAPSATETTSHSVVTALPFARAANGDAVGGT